MMIVKLTVLSIVITAIFVLAIRLWVSAFPEEYLKATITKKNIPNGGTCMYCFYFLILSESLQV